MSSLRARTTISTAVLVLSAPLSAQVMQRVSLGPNGVQANDTCWESSLSADGRYVAFSSPASNLVPGDTLGHWDVFVRDRVSGTTERVSVSSSGVQGNDDSDKPWISLDGRYVVFSSYASNLVPGDTNGVMDVFLRDRSLGTTALLSVATGGAQGNDFSRDGSMSADGRYLAFSSRARQLVPGDTNFVEDVFVRDLQALTTERISISTAGDEGDSLSGEPSISADGRYVVFMSWADNLVAGDTNSTEDIFVRDLQLGTTTRVSVAAGGGQANGPSSFPAISSDGRFVTFSSDATNLAPGDTDGHDDIYLRDLLNDTTELISVSSQGVKGNADSWEASAASDDGRFVAFTSLATNLTADPLDSGSNLFLRDRQNGTTVLVSVNRTTSHPNPGYSQPPRITSDGAIIVFPTYAGDLIPGDTNTFADVYLYDRFGVPNFTSLCDPGVGGVIDCPCGNPASGAGRGCDNSAGTGGAVLAATGGAYLSSDTLQFTTSGEKPTATSVLLQGTSSPAAGDVYGQGVRCVGGTLKRLFTKHAVGGSVTAPDWLVDSSTVSTRSAALGNPISAGESRWYLIFYRDPVVLGGCPSTSTFNATQTGLVSWAP
jgi:Tol biopolymer transport system component